MQFIYVPAGITSDSLSLITGDIDIFVRVVVESIDTDCKSTMHHLQIQ